MKLICLTKLSGKFRIINMSILKVEPSDLVKKLSQTAGGDFYLVGGFVRNALLCRKCDDEDVCSALTLEILAKKLEGSEFVLKNKNKFLGTCKIVCGEKSFDYATFRKEKYEKGHTPTEVTFIKDLKQDAKRRDFTINAIYYDPLTDKIIDPFNGISDLKRKKLRAINEEILKDDGQRILRLLRLAGELNFSIDKRTLIAAHSNIENIRDLTKAKVNEEIQKLFDRTTNRGAARAINLYNHLGVWKRLGFKVDHIRPHMLSKCDDKYMGFVIDVIDTVKPASVSYFLMNMLEDAGFPKKRLRDFINIISGYYDALNHLKNKQYFFKYFDNFPEILKILSKKSKFLAQKYNFFYRYIIAHKLVIKTGDLKISAKDLKKNFPSMPEKVYDKVLMEALSDVFDGKCNNVTEDLISDIGRHHYHKFS